MNEASEEDIQNFSKSDLGAELEKVALSVDNLENLLALQGETYLDETFADLKNAALDTSDILSEGLNHSKSTTNLNDSLEHNTSGLSSHRTMEMLLYLHNRSLSLDSLNFDEWDNDDDTGLVVINISKEEFVEFDQVSFTLPLFCYVPNCLCSDRQDEYCVAIENHHSVLGERSCQEDE